MLKWNVFASTWLYRKSIMDKWSPVSENQSTILLEQGASYVA